MIWLVSGCLFGQSPNLSWQEQILWGIDEEEFGEEQYARLLEILSDLDLEKHINYNDSIDSIARPNTPIRLKQQVMTRVDGCLNQREGFKEQTAQRKTTNKAYLGDPTHIDIRYSLQAKTRNHGTWKAGFTADKGAGEPWRKQAPWADSYSAYLAYSNNNGWLRQAIVGQYRLRLGVGLLLNQQYSLGKKIMSASLLQNNPMLTARSSATSDDYLQGVAARIRIGSHLEILPFASVRQLDGTLTHDTLTSWSATGYHRTQNEADKRNALWLTNLGTRVRWQGEWYEVAANLLYSQFEYTYYQPQRAYNANYFRGHELLQGSIDYRMRYWGFQLQGEAAIDDHGGLATLHALRHALGESWHATALLRAYSNRYHQIWASAVAESGAMQGEQGVTLMLEGNPWRRWQLQAMADWFNFSQPQYNSYQPCSGYELSVRANYEHHSWKSSLGYRLKSKHRNNTLTTKVTDDLTPYYQQTADARVQYTSRTGLQLTTHLRSRIYSAQDPGGMELGYALSQAVAWLPTESATWGRSMKGELQATWFDTDSYNARLYLSERNIMYGGGIPMLNGQGLRATLTLSCKIGKRIQAEGKYAFTKYNHVSGIGSGLQQIDGRYKNDLWLQLRATF